MVVISEIKVIVSYTVVAYLVWKLLHSQSGLGHGSEDLLEIGSSEPLPTHNYATPVHSGLQARSPWHPHGEAGQVAASATRDHGGTKANGPPSIQG